MHQKHTKGVGLFAGRCVKKDEQLNRPSFSGLAGVVSRLAAGPVCGQPPAAGRQPADGKHGAGRAGRAGTQKARSTGLGQGAFVLRAEEGRRRAEQGLSALAKALSQRAYAAAGGLARFGAGQRVGAADVFRPLVGGEPFAAERLQLAVGKGAAVE